MAVIGILALAGCGAGQLAQTSRQVPDVAGADSADGPVVLRDAQIVPGAHVDDAAVYRRGDSAPLRMWIVNQTGQADRLLTASSPAATTVSISGDVDVPPGEVVAVTGGPGPPGAPGGEASRTARMALVGLREDIRAGRDYTLTLTFQHASQITLAVPVGSPPDPTADQESLRVAAQPSGS